MKTVQVSYLEDVASRAWMEKNLSAQEKSRFIREAVAAKIAALKAKKVVKK